ncbi:M16 family metallopeptidase [Pseudobacteroides cellulosolvens]|uniref:Processing peptidase n=1 Tax=Pseudobacteroides cellulosolvens ATCC 35603 = DSM 2933 TaxID=398512 RepID=A0A0L6JI28_9FIRM|nr:pitrilysin family protein [Pseudobacteroides cellulosolvens]KNY25132.1 processing peptidase [Pseudobacteroides cellulosolvens ATCC 35603 = DSM 2933]
MFKRTILENGVRIVCEKIPYVRSVSIGIWVGTGSRNENRDNNGISHFIEHMLFKGTNTRSAKDIAESIDNIGGQLNAFTGKECTCYYTKTLDTHIDIALDVLSDMFFNSKFDQKDIEVERKVIIEEIGMYQDSPEELVHDVLSETIWQDDTLGYPILGTQDSLKGITRESIVDYIGKNYVTGNSVISVAGNYDDDALIGMINERFSKWPKTDTSNNEYNTAKFKPNSIFMEKDTEQVHMCIGFNGISHGRDDIYTLLAVNNIFGGGMSSRLFQKIREEKGLVYSIYSYPASYKNNGLYTIYAGMNPEHMEKVIELVVAEIKEIKKSGISKEDLEKSKEQLKGNYILGLESTSSRMNSIGKSELMLGRIYSPDEILKKIDDISMDNASRIIDQIFDFDLMGFSAVGSIKNKIEVKNFI